MEKTLYSQEEILKDHVFIFDMFFEGKTIIICTTKKENKYNFFIKKENGYEIVTGAYYKKLVNKFLPKNDGVYNVGNDDDPLKYALIRGKKKPIIVSSKYGKIKFYINYEGNEKLIERDNKGDLIKDVVDCVNSNISRMEELKIDPNIIHQAFFNLDDLVVELTTNQLKEHTAGTYRLRDHSLIVPITPIGFHFVFTEKVMQHELYHAMSANENFCGVSFSQFMKKTGKEVEDKNVLSLHGFNELITEGLVGKVGNKYLGYTSAMKHFSILFQDFPPIELYEAYFQNNQVGILRLFQKEFGIPTDASIRYFNREDVYCKNLYNSLLSNSFSNMKANMLADSVLFSVNRIWNKSRDVKISDFVKMTKASNIDSNILIVLLFEGLVYADKSFLEEVNYHKIATNVLQKLNAVQFDNVVNRLALLKLKSDYFDGKMEGVNTSVLNDLLNILGKKVNLHDSKAIIENFGGPLREFVYNVLEKEYQGKENKLFSLALLNEPLRPWLARACLMKEIKKDKSYTGVAKIFETVTNKERNGLFNQLAKYMLELGPDKSVEFVDPNTLKILVDKYGEETIGYKQIASNLFDSLSKDSNFLTQLSWKQISDLFHAFEDDQDILLKKLYLNSAGKEINVKGDFNMFSTEEKESIWEQARKAIGRYNHEKTMRLKISKAASSNKKTNDDFESKS